MREINKNLIKILKAAQGGGKTCFHSIKKENCLQEKG